MVERKDIDDVSGVETTGHDWDGIKELNNPLPRWWLWTFYACIVWAMAYTVFYPAWPGITGATAGVLGWSSRADLTAEMAAAKEAQSVWLNQLETADVETIAANPELVQFAVAGGASNFKVYCIQCHGSGAAGGGGYPNLNDDDWLWGGKLTDIETTLLHGIRHEPDPDTRLSAMPRYGADELLTKEEITDVAWFVRKLSNQDTDVASADRGSVIFAEQCAACHGEVGEGLAEFGAPALNDAIWLYGGAHEQIVAQINLPKQGVMPAWGDRLGATTVKQLAVYVHQLGGGQ